MKKVPQFVPRAWKLVLPVATIYLVVALVGIFHHEIWLDEAHHWLLARDSSSLGEMIHNARYDGHPLLWNFILFFLAKSFSGDLNAMQLGNVLIAFVAAVIFLRYAPFRFTTCIAIILGYFFIYEYSVISRNYALLWLCVVIVCVNYTRRNEKPWRFLISLFLLSQTHLFGTIAAVLFMLIFIFENRDKNKSVLVYSISCLIISVAIVCLTAIPPAGHFLFNTEMHEDHLQKAIPVLLKAFFPLPDFLSASPWNSNFLISHVRWLAMILSVFVWFIPLLALENRRALLFFYASSVLICLFIYYTPLVVGIRYCGVILVIFIAAMWMDHNESPSRFSLLPDRFRQFSRNYILPIVWLVQLIAGIFLFAADYRRPFSEAKAVAEWLTANTKGNEFIIVHDHTSGPPIALYFGRKLYYVEEHREGTFCKWNTIPFMVSDAVAVEEAEQARRAGYEVILINNRPLPKQDLGPGMRLVAMFNKGMLKTEEYYIYREQK